MKILWVKAGALFPLDSGGKKRTHAMLEQISKRHDVTYLALLNEGQNINADEERASYASEKIWLSWRETDKRSWRIIPDLLYNIFFSSLPYALAKYASKPLQEWLESPSKLNDFDLVICDFLFPAINFQKVNSHVPLVLFQHNMEAVIRKRLAETSANPIKRFYLNIQYRRFAVWERRLSKLFDGVITVSDDDSLYAREEYGLANVRGSIPTGVDVSHFAPPKKITEHRHIIGFLGSMDWMPNIQAVIYFVEQIYPQIKKAVPNVQFVVIGRNPPKSIRDLARDDSSIRVTGTVEDVRPELKACDLMVVPLLAGGGTRIKILEAMAMGVPVASTTIGAEGLGMIDGKDLVIADSPSDFAGVTIEMLKAPDQCAEIAANAMQKIAEANSWESCTDRFIKLCKITTS